MTPGVSLVCGFSFQPGTVVRGVWGVGNVAILRSASKGKKLGVGRHDDGFYHEATKSRRYLKKRHDNNHAEDGPDRGFRELRGYDGANGSERFVSSGPARSGAGR